MGGRLDATNVLEPLVSIITNVEREHQQYLGKTRGKIAFEKAGIIKGHIPVVTAEWKKPVLRVFEKKCKEAGARLSVVRQPYAGKLALLGSFQKWNAATAVAAVKELQEQGIAISEKAVQEGLSSAKWPGRFQVVRKKPAVVLDCAHNPACCVVLAKAFKEKFPGKKALLVIGVSNDKNAGEMAKRLAPIAGRVLATGARHRALQPEKLAGQFKALSVETGAVHGVGTAVKRAVREAGPDGIVLVTGSCFVVGEAMQALHRLNQKK
ncbi:MAG: hypothetical protein JW744_03375, partial [Candidatus Diapherotrites archaeon]|nr:hypothetical protein [Candidatus Diapherotrites archaeon]